MKKIYCTAPWHGITVRENGTVRTCCPGISVIADLNKDSIDKIESSSVLQDIRKKMLRGEIDEKNCKMCLEQEKTAGVASLREHYLKYYPEIDDIHDDQIKPSVIDVRWNNVCNLGCVYCTPVFSSIWEDRLSIKNPLKPVKTYQDSLLDWILERVEHVKEIQLVGGEPMLMKQNYMLFKRLPKDCKISILTNLSYDLKNLPCLENLLERPTDKVLWNISAENINEKFEYVRSGAKWAKFLENLEFLVENFPEQVTILMTYNMLSAIDLPETVKKFVEIGIKKIVLQPLFDNRGVNVFFMPPIIRNIAAEKLSEAVEIHRLAIHPEDRELYRIDLQEDILKKLQQNSINGIVTKQEVYSQLAYYDKWNDRKFSELWPELDILLQQNLS